MKAKSRLPHNYNKKYVKGLGYVSKSYQKDNVLGFLRSFSIITSLTLGCACVRLHREDISTELINPWGGTSNFIVRAIEPVEEATAEAELKVAKITAYSCGGLTTEAEIDMNCPSLRYSENGRTSDGTEPIPYKTMACDPANMGRTFEIEGVGVVKCTDTGGAIKGAGRFDLYVENVEEAYQWGVKYKTYKEI